MRNALSLLAVLVLTTACGTETRDRSGDPGDGRAADAGTSAGQDAGQGNGGGGTDLQGLTEYGSGEYAIFLSEEPRRYCWFVEETDRVCDTGSGGRRDTNYRNVCFDDELNCLAVQPEDSERETNACFIRITYDNVSRGPLFGTCDDVDRYFNSSNSEVQCLFHRHCPDGRKCADYQCVCPQGADCACFDTRPLRGPRCEGDVLLSERYGDGCDAQGSAIVLEDRVDCAATGGTCRNAQCVGGSGGGTDGGVVTTDGGEPGPVDAGSCECPPVAPPRCDGNRQVMNVCDPVTCQVSEVVTDCEASRQICDPSTAACLDVECLDASDCPTPGPTPVGTCIDVSCTDNACVSTTRSC